MTKAGKVCLNNAGPGSRFCGKHASHVSLRELATATAGAVIGNAVFPGIGGLLAGSAITQIARKFTAETAVKRRVFVSFDFDNDRVLKDFLLGQANLPGSPFEVTNYSLKEAAEECEWEAKARSAINRAEIVVVIIGPHTYKAQGVLKEVSMAREANVQIVQLIGYNKRKCIPIPNAGRVYTWTWPNLKNLLR